MSVPGVHVVRELLQRHREREVFALLAERERVGAALVGERLRSAQRLRDEPDPVALRARERLDERSHAIALILAGNGRGLDHVDARADSHRRGRRRILRLAPRHLGVLVEGVHLEEERRAGNLDVLVGHEEGLGNRVDLVVIGVGRVDDGELAVAGALDELDGLPLLDGELHLDLEEAGHELAGEEDDEPEVDDPEPGLAEAHLEAPRLRGDEVQGQHEADHAAARKHRDVPGRPGHRAPDEEAADVGVHRPEHAHLDLREGAGDDEHHQEHEADDGQLEGRQRVHDPVSNSRHRSASSARGGGSRNGKRRRGSRRQHLDEPGALLGDEDRGEQPALLVAVADEVVDRDRTRLGLDRAARLRERPLVDRAKPDLAAPAVHVRKLAARGTRQHDHGDVHLAVHRRLEGGVADAGGPRFRPALGQGPFERAGEALRR